ncbi:Uncharacterised protein [Bordetella pertussis]|nr:Uncharacterised protein [Bordetella pertussis]
MRAMASPPEYVISGAAGPPSLRAWRGRPRASAWHTGTSLSMPRVM